MNARDRRRFAPLPRGSAAGRRWRVAVVLPPLPRPCGLAAALTALADTLGDAGHDVAVLEAGGRVPDAGAATRAGLPDSDVPLVGLPSACRSYRVYEWLKARSPDVVHLPLSGGVGYFAQLAKEQGLALGATEMVVHAGAPTWWRASGNGRPLDDVDQVLLDHLERGSAERADTLVSASASLLTWMIDRGWTLPSRTYVQALPTPALAPAGRETHQIPLEEIVLFGRLEPRKGVMLFCDAIDRLVARRAPPELRVGFVGDHVSTFDFDSAAYIDARSRAWPTRPLHRRFDGSREAIEELRKPGRLAVIPSLLDHAPMTVAECLAAGVPFVATAVGDIAELIDPADRERALVAPTPEALAGRLFDAIRSGTRRVAPARPPGAAASAWVEWHASRPAEAAPVGAPVDDEPLVSVCLATRNRGRLLRQALESIQAQTHPRVEVVLVDDGSDEDGAARQLAQLEVEFAARSWVVIRADHKGAPAARNLAATAARGEFLLFMDDDNVARPDEIATLVSVARTNRADAVTCAFDAFDGPQPPGPDTRVLFRSVPVGAALGLGAVVNGFGDTNGLVRRTAFAAVGGFDEDGAPAGRRGQDWHLWFKLAAQGFRLAAVPEPMFWYRVTANSVSRRPHGKHEPPTALDLARLLPVLPDAVRPYGAALSLAAGLHRRAQQRVPTPIESAVLVAYAVSLARSRSWTITRPLRDALARWRGAPAEGPPVIADAADALTFIGRVHGSMSWEVLAPFRLAVKAMHRIAAGIRRRHRESSDA